MCVCVRARLRVRVRACVRGCVQLLSKVRHTTAGMQKLKHSVQVSDAVSSLLTRQLQGSLYAWNAEGTN